MAKAVPNGPGPGAVGGDDGDDEAPVRPDRPRTPRALRAAAIVTLVQAVALGGGGIYWLVRTLLDRPESFSASLAGAIFALLAALLLVRLAIGIARIEGWSRSPLVVLQILFLPVAYTLAFPAGQPLVGVPVLALCLTVLYLIFTPEGRLAFMHR